MTLLPQPEYIITEIGMNLAIAALKSSRSRRQYDIAELVLKEICLASHQSEREKVLENLIAWIRETKDMARTNLDHDWGTRGDRHVELILSQVLDKYDELRQSKDGEP